LDGLKIIPLKNLNSMYPKIAAATKSNLGNYIILTKMIMAIG
jgi:hypothetical protein